MNVQGHEKVVLLLNNGDVCSPYKLLNAPADLERFKSQRIYVTSIVDETAAQQALQVFKDQQAHIVAFVSNVPARESFKLAQKLHPRTKRILISDLPTTSVIDVPWTQLIAGDDEHWARALLRLGLSQSSDLSTSGLLQKDRLTEERFSIVSSKSRTACLEAAVRFCEGKTLSKHAARAVTTIAEEFFMNAVFDAPVASGLESFVHLARGDERDFSKLQRKPELCFLWDGDTAVVQARDPFGALKAETFYEYMAKIKKRSEGEEYIDQKEMGAGLGLLKVLYHSHGIVCRVKKGVETEVSAFLFTKSHLRDFAKMARSIQYIED